MNKVLEHIEKVEHEKITVDDIKKEYNNPVSAARSRDTGYCVGGAVFLFFGDNKKNFPDAEQITKKLMQINPRLFEKAALTFAEKIINNNDTGNFENAWTQLRLALNYGKEK